MLATWRAVVPALIGTTLLLAPWRAAAQNPTYVPQRVYDTKAKRFSDFEALTARASLADVVFFGEQHDDPGTHRMERALLEGLARRRGRVVVSLEMFERDVQSVVDAYLANRIPESELLAQARPWQNYTTDYRPLVEFAKEYRWAVVAANVPRPFAAAVASKGLAVLDTLPPIDRQLIAQDIQCPHNDYFDRFAREMRGHTGIPGGKQPADSAAGAASAMVDRFFAAQCIKDETMAESIAQAYQRSGPRALVVQFNGSFHSDYRLGTAARTARRLPDATILVISALPVADLDTVAPTDEQRKLGDFLLFTLAPPTAHPDTVTTR